MTIPASGGNAQAEEGFTQRREDAKEGFGRRGMVASLWRVQVVVFCFGWEEKWVRLVKLPGFDWPDMALRWVPWVRWVRRKNVSVGNRGLLGFGGHFRGVCPRGAGGLEWEADCWMDESISAGPILAWRKRVLGGTGFVFNE
jgi:hypothetical protein